MATPDAGGPSRQPHVPTETGSESPSSSPPGTSSWANDTRNLLHRVGTVCPWRTTRYYDQECSRYFDCPSHVVERALSDTEQGEEVEQEEHQGHEDEEPEDIPAHSDTGTVSPLSEAGDESDGERTARSPSPEASVATTEVTNAAAGAGRTSEVPGARQEGTEGGLNDGPRLGDWRLPARPRPEAETPAASGSGSGEGHSGVSTSPVPGPVRGDSAPASGPQAVHNAASPAPATRLVSRPPHPIPAPTERARPEVVLPRWQPDSEQTYCPICGTQFSIFVRKHHCRKCGRVVCNACSPHRITIPHQYIVRPPGAPLPLAQEPSLSLLDSQGWYPEFDGGERVRLCNPCVPDPNTAPPHSQEHQPRPQNDSSPHAQSDDSPSNRWSFYFGTGTVNDAQTRTRSVTLQPGPSSSSRPPIPPPRSNEGRILWGTPPAYYRAPSTSQAPHPYPGAAPRYRSVLDVVGDRPGPATNAGPSSSSSAARRFHSVVPPRPQIAEEDECPVCHRELPPRTLANFEALREAHITSCIISHSRYGAPVAGGGGTGGGEDGDEDDDPDALPIGPPPARRTGMFPYTATEKDCVDSAECSICLEEFEVGVAMARLECLCRFHRACINAWWERHPGRCPMHQHDGFGY